MNIWKTIGIGLCTFILGMILMYLMLAKGISFLSQMSGENQLDQAVVTLGWFDSGNLEHTRYLLLLDVCSSLDFVKEDKHPFFSTATPYTEKVLEMASRYETECSDLIATRQ